tara:strand:+ start:397 stop:1533 length:1137 start_codon:yes stop_codon:yes gene_type:complete
MAVFKGSSVRYYDSTNQKFVRIQGSQATGSDYTLQLPPDVGGADQVLKLPSAISDTNQLVWGDAGGDSSQTVLALTTQGTDATTTSQAIYGVNLIDTATAQAFATRLPDASTGKQVTFVNTSTVSILVFPSVTGGKINGVVDGYASIPNDGTAYTFTCIQNPLPGAWTWSPPAVNQIQFPRISITHTQGSTGFVWGVGIADGNSSTSCSAQWFTCRNINWLSTPLQFTNNGATDPVKSWATYNLTPARTITTTKVYSNVLDADTDGTNYPTIGRYVSFPSSQGGANYTASSVSLGPGYNTGAVDGKTVAQGPLSSPPQIGDAGTNYKIQPMGPIQVSPTQTDLIGIGPDGPHYLIYVVSVPFSMQSGTYDFDIFIEHT